ncbi:MAG: hypothetical protein JWP00_1410 [Chloroflexi bacterium]|jgi:hypothetical protein|nr:hypothetical protein [Chloroflexota bacterium]
MNYNRLFENDGAVFYAVGLEPAELMPLRLELARQQPGLTLRVIRGDKSTNEETFFNEAGAVLQFPEYFIEVWEDFEKCLNDLSWLPAGPTLLLVSFGPFILCDEVPGVFSGLVEILYRAARNRQTGPFKVLFQAAPGDLPAFLDRLKETGADYTVLTD